MFPGANHDQHDGFMNHDHDHETSETPIKIGNQTIFAQEHIKKPIQIYDKMVNILK